MNIAAGTRLGQYEIRSKLGEGGMGEVYLAEDTRLRRRVALKILPENLSANADRLLRFEREAFAASALNHPNILTIFEFSAVNRNWLDYEKLQSDSRFREIVSQLHLSRMGVSPRNQIKIGKEIPQWRNLQNLRTLFT